MLDHEYFEGGSVILIVVQLFQVWFGLVTNIGYRKYKKHMKNIYN